MASDAVSDDTGSNPAATPPSADPSTTAASSASGVSRPFVRRRLGLIVGVAAIVILVDQLTKAWAVDALRTRTIDVVWTLRLYLVHNTGASFSLANGSGPVIGVLALAVVAFLVWHGRGTSSKVAAVGIGLVLGGAIGNLLDRAFRGDAGFMHGAVVDFIDFQWWPIFNVADMGVVIGGFVVVLVYAFRPDDVAGGSD